jgi:hypothetical protein
MSQRFLAVVVTADLGDEPVPDPKGLPDHQSAVSVSILGPGDGVSHRDPSGRDDRLHDRPGNAVARQPGEGRQDICLAPAGPGLRAVPPAHIRVQQRSEQFQVGAVEGQS